MIRQHLLRALADPQAFNAQLVKGDYHIFIGSLVTSGEYEPRFNDVHLELVYKSPPCYNTSHWGTPPRIILYVFKTKETV